MMSSELILAYTVVAALAIASPGPAVVLALRNATAYGWRSSLYSSLGNITGIFVLSALSMMGLGVLLMSSAILFTIVKVLGAVYLFYIGLRHIFGRNQINATSSVEITSWTKVGLFKESVLIALTNPKPIIFFSALFPQFLLSDKPLLPQFLILTGIFMSISFLSLTMYAVFASRARGLLVLPSFSKWVNRIIGTSFIGFGGALMLLRKPTA
jgi:homoserine/homoserine lactone efflux protein